ncbi:MAG TPA: PAS domain-containing protein [Syntrophales bacterium]|nr:PAS domain-containing protein [Syntrophales bacterium]
MMKNPRSDDLISADDRCPPGHALLDGPGGRYPDMFDFSPVPHLILDRNGLMIGVNLAGARMFGCKRKALLKEPITRFMEPGDQPAFHEHFKTLGRRHTARACAIHIRRTDGTPLTISFESIPVQDDFGHVLGCRTSIIDISNAMETDGMAS